MSEKPKDGPVTYRLQSSGFLNAPGLVAWAKNGYKFERDKQAMVTVVTASWPGVPEGAAIALLSGATTLTVENGTVVFDYEPAPALPAGIRIRDEYLDRHQTAAELGISYTGVIRLMTAPDGLKWIKIGKKHMTKREWIREYLARNTKQPNPQRK